MNYQEIKMYDIIKDEMKNVLEAEENSKAWKSEARSRMRDVTALITAAKKVNKGIEIDNAELVKAIRDEIAAEIEEASAYADEEEPSYPEETEEAGSEA